MYSNNIHASVENGSSSLLSSEENISTTSSGPQIPGLWPVGDKGGDCRRQRVTYNLYCETCQGERNLRVKVASYPGETGRNMFEQGKEHLALLQKQSEENSVLWLHSLHHHEGSTDVRYKMVCTGTYNTPLDRPMSEKIEISHFQGYILMNRKNDFFSPIL